MVDLDARAERLKLARLLGVDPDEVAFLERLPAETLQPVRERVSDLLLAQGRARFDRLVAASRLLPDPLSVAIAQRVFPPLIAAQIAGRLEPQRGAALVRHADVGYLADMAERTDPRLVAHLVPALPTDVAVAAARELMARRDHLAAGRLVGLAPERMIPALVDAVDDPADLLEIAFYLERRDRLDAIVRHVDDEQLAQVLEVARERDLWAEALLLAGHLGEEQTRRLAAVVADAPEATLSALLEAVHRHGLWERLLPLVARVDEARLGPVAGAPVLRRPEVVAAVVDAAEGTAHLPVVLRIVAAMDDDDQRELAEQLRTLAADRRERLAAAARDEGLLDRLGAVAEAL